MNKSVQAALLTCTALSCKYAHANNTRGFYVGADYNYVNNDITGDAADVNNELSIT